MSGNVPEVSSLWLWSGWIDYVVVQHFSRSVTISFLCFTMNSVLVLFLVLCEVSVHVFVHVHVQAKSSNGTTVRTFSNFNLLCGSCTLIPSLSALTSFMCSCQNNCLTALSKHIVYRTIKTHCPTALSKGLGITTSSVNNQTCAMQQQGDVKAAVSIGVCTSSRSMSGRT